MANHCRLVVCSIKATKPHDLRYQQQPELSLSGDRGVPEINNFITGKLTPHGFWPVWLPMPVRLLRHRQRERLDRIDRTRSPHASHVDAGKRDVHAILMEALATHASISIWSVLPIYGPTDILRRLRRRPGKMLMHQLDPLP